MELHDIILRPLVTEKTSRMMAADNTFTFVVGVGANKHQIATAVESLYGVNVLDVRTVNVRGKSKRFGSHVGKRSNWKKAYIKLSDGDTLNIYES
jgi:large subunit ribosomal protein L23